MSLVHIASSAHTSIRITDQPMPGADFGYVAELAGNRDMGAVAGYGITYDVDEDVYTQWTTAHPEQAAVLRVVTEQEIDAMRVLESSPLVYGYEQGMKAPIVRDVPYASQTGSTLNCTMGNWLGTPDSYSYAWQIDGVDAGTDSATYPVTPGDVGSTATCTVTASNAKGSTTAPPSNAVIVA